GLAAHLRQLRNTDRFVMGFLDEQAPVRGDVHGRVSDLARVIQSQFIDEIVITPPYGRELVQRVAREARRNRISVAILPDLFGFAPQSVSFGILGDTPVLKLYEERRPLISLFFKRAMDVLMSTAILLCVAPLLAAIAALIRLDSSGSVLYRSLRVGKKGHNFVCYKLRTMIAGADRLQEELRAQNERQGPFFKMGNDPRITRLGRFLRRYSIDELPQLWNVFKGEMSMVGPRPHPLPDFEGYELDHLRRLNITPGLTGLWQITARSDPSFERNMELDLEYIEHWSLWLDIKILWKTIAVVLRGTGL
ncbi:MAG TPA: exopolysaccharide biosynthesis polyprenyl glycosylphosphotransferase, partial [Terriglobales bacterium]|nr:exopolysaccharide biosynthesis polyprenyl glycosylphosphotransferase [Terriglobales bacterium]